MKKIMFVFLAIISGCIFHTSNAQEPSCEKELKKIEASIKPGDCNKFWNMIWPLVKQRCPEAHAMLAKTANVWAGLMPPGTHDVLALQRHWIVFIAYAAANGDPASIEMLKRILRSDKPYGKIEGENFKKCMDSDEPPRHCVEAAVKEKLLPDFETYAKEMDALIAAGASPAYCRGIHDYMAEKTREDNASHNKPTEEKKLENDEERK